MLVLRLMFDGKLRGAEAALLRLLDDEPAARQSERVDARLHCRKVDAGVDQGAERHVAAERARCAAVCREVAVAYTEAEYPYRAAGALECAEAIERGAVER